MVVFGVSLDYPLDLHQKLLVKLTQRALRLLLTQVLEQEKHVVVWLTFVNGTQGVVLGASHSLSLVAFGQRPLLLAFFDYGGTIVVLVLSVACIFNLLLFLIFDLNGGMVFRALSNRTVVISVCFTAAHTAGVITFPHIGVSESSS